jgi:hypothetical protein
VKAGSKAKSRKAQCAGRPRRDEEDDGDEGMRREATTGKAKVRMGRQAST